MTALSPNHKVMASYLWYDKIRGHRRDSNDKIPDIAAVVQTNPVQTTQVRYTGVYGPRLVFESGFSVMDGQTNYSYQPGTPADAIRKIDNSLGEVFFAAPRHEEQPNSRHQFDNVLSTNTQRFGGFHALKGGVQWARLYFEQRCTVQGHHHRFAPAGAPEGARFFHLGGFAPPAPRFSTRGPRRAGRCIAVVCFARRRSGSGAVPTGQSPRSDSIGSTLLARRAGM